MAVIGRVPPEVIQEVVEVWPSSEWDGWYSYTGDRGLKKVSKPGKRLPSSAYEALWKMANLVTAYDLVWPGFVDHSLYAAGLHWILPGGSLPRHLDADRHPENPWRRTHSIVCFLDTLDQGGELVLEDGKHVIQPTAGDVVVFETQGNWHWVNETKQDRRTLALFAYQNATGPEFWQGRDRALFENKDAVCSSRDSSRCSGIQNCCGSPRGCDHPTGETCNAGRY